MVVKLGAVVYMTPVFIIPGLAIGVLGGRLGNIYVKAQLSVKREMSNARSPVFSHFNAAIAGLRASLLSYHSDSLFTEIKASIRAYGAQDAFKQSSLTRIDKYTRSVKNTICAFEILVVPVFRCARSFYNLNRYVHPCCGIRSLLTCTPDGSHSESMPSRQPFRLHLLPI